MAQYSNPETAQQSLYSNADIQTDVPIQQIRPKATPTRFWKWCNESNFKIVGVVAEGNFGKVTRGYFKSREDLPEKHKNFANLEVALKYPKDNSTFFNEFHTLSHEISCTLIHHPSIVNYMGGLNITNPKRVDPDGVGVVMEYCETDLRRALKAGVLSTGDKLRIAKEIASGMMFLHTQNPYILHRDLRCPNILLTAGSKRSRIADFGISTNMGYTEMAHEELYSDLAPPETRRNKEYLKKSDTYFYGYLLVELFSGEEAGNSTPQTQWASKLSEQEKKWALACISPNVDARPEWDDLIKQFNSLSNVKHDLELIAKTGDHNAIADYIKEVGWDVAKSAVDEFGRTLFHQCCLFGNFAGLKHLVALGGPEALKAQDHYGLNCAHFAARNGYLDILHYLASHHVNFDEMDKRFDTTPLTLAIAFKHFECVKFLGTQVSQASKDAGLVSAASEGNVEVVENLLNIGASLAAEDMDLKKTPLMWASSNGHPQVVEVLIKRGAFINHVRKRDNVSAVYQAAEKGQLACVAILLKNGADLTIRRNDNSTPFWQACWKGHYDVVKFLIEQKVNIFASKNTTSPLQIAKKQGHTQIVDMLERAYEERKDEKEKLLNESADD